MSIADAPTRCYDVIGLGIATQDFIGLANHEPHLGGKQRLTGWVEQGGGPVATALVTLARLGMSGCIVGSVGDDVYGQRIIADLQHEGVATEGLQVLPGTSHIAFILVEPQQGRRTVWAYKDRPGFDTLTLDRTLITSARALLIDTYMPATSIVAARWMREAGGYVMIDAERCNEDTLALLPYCDSIIASEDFGHAATGAAEPAQMVQMLYEAYQRPIIVTCGESGSWCASDDDAFHTPAFTMTPVDTTGAGDVFHGAFLYGVLQGWSLRETARFASATAALKCRQAGGRAGIPTHAEIAALMYQFS